MTDSKFRPMWCALDGVLYFRPDKPRLARAVIEQVARGHAERDAHDRVGALRQAALLVLTECLHEAAAIESPWTPELVMQLQASISCAGEIADMLARECRESIRVATKDL